MSWLESVGNFIDDHKSGIAFGAGVIFTGATTVLAVKATPKAIDAIKEKQEEKGQELTFWEKVKVSWKHYIWPAATEVVGVTCLFFGKSIDIKATNAALAAADISQNLLRTYGRKVVEEIGEKKEEEIRKAVVAEREKDIRPVTIRPTEECCLMDGDSWYFDPLFGKKFISSDVKIKAALNALNHKILYDDSASYNDFFDEIYASTPVPINKELFCDLGDTLGFVSGDGILDIEYDTLDLGIRINGVKTPAFAIRFVNKDTGRTKFPESII